MADGISNLEAPAPLVAQCNPGGEDARLDALHLYRVLDTAPEEAFERITRLAKTMMQMPLVTVSLVDEDRQWFKSRQGMGAAQTARDISFCTHTIESPETLIVTDASVDPRFADSPLVVGEPYIRFYIGVPLRSYNGYNVGALCAMDTKPRHPTPEQIGMLQDLARLVVDELELRLQATTDNLTGALQRRAFQDEAKRDIALAKRHHKNLSCILLDADRFKVVNDTYGHGAGDVVLQRLVSICREEIREADYIGRIGGEEFAIMMPETSTKSALGLAERLRKRIEATEIRAGGHRIAVTVSLGIATRTAADMSIDDILRKADIAMYGAKSAGRNRSVCFCDPQSALSAGAAA